MLIGTFYNPRSGRPPVKTRISAYSLWYNPAWSGCVEFDIDSTNSKAARRKAVDLRLELEQSKVAT